MPTENKKKKNAPQILIREQVFIRTNTIQKARPSLWCLHGFGDSGQAYEKVFDSDLSEVLNVYVVDLPGFGSSPLNEHALSIQEQAQLLTRIIREETIGQAKVNIVAHSLGALIGTWICQNLDNKINHYFSIEGNLTEADSYFSSKPLQFSTADAFVDAFQNEVFERAQREERYRRYYSNLRFASPEGMVNWARTSQEHVKGNKCGAEFMALNCNKTYIWGKVDTPMETQTFISDHGVPNRLYEQVGHWHMVTNATALYKDMLERIEQSQAPW